MAGDQSRAYATEVR